MRFVNNLMSWRSSFVSIPCIVSFLSTCHNSIMIESDKSRLTQIDCTAKPSFSDTSRFIAHAAGGIEGYIYTNSLDALQYSYSQGMRLFEVDLLPTKDLHLVGSHSWSGESGWAVRTGSSVEIPTLAEFKSKLLDNRFQPVDFSDLNTFFSEKKDAILVTDKTEDYLFLAENFVDPNRLLVEVFSENGLKEALNQGIKFPMPSFAYDISTITRLHTAYGIKFFALHHLTTEDLGPSLLQVRSQGICIFAYTSNELEYIDYQLQNGVFGFYTDYYIPDRQAFSCEKSSCVSY